MSGLGTVLITGGASGLGAATVQAVQDAGGTPLVLDLGVPADGVAYRRVDLGDSAAAEQAVHDLVAEHGGHLDGVFTAAGIDSCGPLDSVASDAWERVIRVNLLGTAAVVRASLGYLKESSGRVVTVASTLGIKAVSDATAYCASKFGVVGFTRALAAETAGQVGVTLLIPGGMHTAFFDDRTEQYKPPADAKLNHPSDVAAAVVFALSQPAGCEVRELVVAASTEGVLALSRILLWDVHGGYTDSLIGGAHEYVFPERDAGGRGGLARLGVRAPASAREACWAELRDDPPDVVVLQRMTDLEACAVRLGRRPGRELAAVWLEHNTPRLRVPDAAHPVAEVPGVLIVHVTHFNALLWDCGDAATTVVEHGVADPGHRFSGTRARLAFVVNEPVRRWRVTGTDLLPTFAGLGVDSFGIDGWLLASAFDGSAPEGLRFAGNLSPQDLYAGVARRRAYLHLNRWTSLGLSLIQAMLLGLPVLALDTTEASRAIPAGAGLVSNDLAALRRCAEVLLADRDEAAARGAVARAAALERYPLDRFLTAWDAAFLRAQELVASP